MSTQNVALKDDERQKQDLVYDRDTKAMILS